MKIQIHCKKVELNEAEEAYLREKISSLKKYYDKISDEAVLVKVDIEKNPTLDQKQKIIIGVTMSVSSASFHAEIDALSIEEGVDLLIDKLYRQIEKYKAKDLRHNNLSTAELSEHIDGDIS
jgi:ribosomal subunit interface protein